MRRIAVKVAYDGTRFSGNQVQPEAVRTVHREVERALRALGDEAPRLSWAGRTDAGVSAAGNVMCLHTERDPASLLTGLSHKVDDFWAWAWAEVPEEFEPRHAVLRRYRYHLRSDLDAARVHDALQLFVGAHDFSSFARVEAGVTPQRVVSRIDATRDGPLVVVDVEGPNFLHNQVRRMVEAGRRVAAGEVDAEEVRAALDAGKRRDFGMAPPEPLVLLDVSYGDRVAFQTLDARVLRRVRVRLAERIEAHELSLAVLRDVAGGGAGE